VALPASFDPDQVQDLHQAAGVLLTRVGTVTAGTGLRASLGGRDVTLAGYGHFEGTSG